MRGEVAFGSGGGGSCVIISFEKISIWYLSTNSETSMFAYV